jgi:predicted secreted protein
MTWSDVMICPAATMYRATPPAQIPPSVTHNDPLRSGRIVDIVAALARGDARAARNLIANSPGLDWRCHCSAALVALADGAPPPPATRRLPRRITDDQ